MLLHFVELPAVQAVVTQYMFQHMDCNTVSIQHGDCDAEKSCRLVLSRTRSPTISHARERFAIAIATQCFVLQVRDCGHRDSLSATLAQGILTRREEVDFAVLAFLTLDSLTNVEIFKGMES